MLKQFGAGQFSKVLARIRVLAGTSDAKSLQPGILCQTKLGHLEVQRSERYSFSQRLFHQSSLGGRVSAVAKVAKVTSTPWVSLESNRFCRTIVRVAASVDSAISSRGGHLLSVISVTGFQSCVHLARVFACRVGLRCRAFAGRERCVAGDATPG